MVSLCVVLSVCEARASHAQLQSASPLLGALSPESQHLIIYHMLHSLAHTHQGMQQVDGRGQVCLVNLQGVSEVCLSGTASLSMGVTRALWNRNSRIVKAGAYVAVCLGLCLESLSHQPPTQLTYAG